MASRRAASESLFVAELLPEMNIPRNAPVIYADTKAALDVASKRAIGRVMHLGWKLNALKEWVQQNRK